MLINYLGIFIKKPRILVTSVLRGSIKCTIN
nr:MAG TPA: hypothetical protein [Caudoviricetes sp.]